jgi:hypothetical protein
LPPSIAALRKLYSITSSARPSRASGAAGKELPKPGANAGVFFILGFVVICIECAFEGARMATILQFIRDVAAFDDHATRVMGEAYDAVCADLRDTGQPALVREIIAKRTIEVAEKGERDPGRLRAAASAALGLDRTG